MIPVLHRDAPHCNKRSPARPCSPQLLPQRGSRRDEAERFVAAAFARHYQARVTRFMPHLLGMRSTDGQLMAVCGLRAAALGSLFLERYLEAPVEDLLAAAVPWPVERASITEVGNLAMVPPCSARLFIAALTEFLAGTRYLWVTATVVPTLRNAFRRMQVPLVALGEASTDSLSEGERLDWGSYYEDRPQVVAISVAAASAAIGLEPAAA